MAETDAHYENLTDVRFALRQHLEAQGIEAYVGANIFLYYEEGDPHRCVSPDVFVALDVPPGPRDTYKLWLEGKAPDVVFEFTSRHTRLDDLGTKLGVYILLGVQEYFLFDPRREYLDNRLRGYRRVGGDLVSFVESPMTSRVLGLELVPQGERLRLRPRGGKEFLSTPREEFLRAEAEARARAEAEQRVEAEAKARMALQAELERLQQELARLKGR